MSAVLRILAVEDQAPNVALLRASLRRAADSRLADAELAVAGTLAEARFEIMRGRFDVVILDMRLPDGNGLELARELHALQPPPAIVVVTANALPADEAAAREAGADEFVAKPYEPRALLELLARIAGDGEAGPAG